MTTFKDLALNADIQKALDALGFQSPTEIQKRAIPVLLAPEKIDLHGQAQTGTGKTFAFGIPLIQKLDLNKKAVQGLIVAPTRELVVQITNSLTQMAKFVPVTIEPIYGGVSMPEQISALRRGVHIVVGTPGRLNDHLRRKTLSLKDLKTLVLDEADIMLDMGFKEEVDEILTFAPKDRQIWLFSATVKPGIDDIMRKHMKNPVSVRVSPKDVATTKTKQYFCVVSSRHRTEALCRVIDSAPEFYGFIFCPTKVLTSEIAEKLSRRGYKVNALHGDLSQVQRNRIIKKFREKDFSILVATDVAARGIDISDLTHVINYSLPDDLESYVHRIGRTGRAGKEGIAITFINPSETRKIQMLERKFKAEIKPLDIPTAQEIANVRTQLAADYVKGLIEQDLQKMPHHEPLLVLVDTYPQNEVKKALAALLYDKFLQGLAKEHEIPHQSAANFAIHSDLAELFVSIGQDDGVTKSDIIDYLVATDRVKKEQIQRIKILRGHTFVVVPGDLAPLIIEAVQSQPPMQGKRIRVSLTGQAPFEERGDRGGGHGRDRDRGDRGGYRGGYSRGGDRGRSRRRY